MKKHLLFLALLFTIFCPGTRAAVVELDIEKLALRSSHIFCGEVIEIRCQRGEFLGLGKVLLTDVRIRVSEIWKDTPGQRPEITRSRKTGRITEITIRYLGGKIGDSWQKCAASPTFSPAEKVLVFARKLNGRLSTTGWFQGKYRLEPGAPTGSSSPAGKLVRGGKHLPIRKKTDLAALRLQVQNILRREKLTGKGGTEK